MTFNPGSGAALKSTESSGEHTQHYLQDNQQVAFKALTLSLDTAEYASGDVLADTQEIVSAFRAADVGGILQSLIVNDEDDQVVDIDFYLLDANVSFGAENAAVAISDANARNILGRVSVAQADFKDLGGVKVAVKTGLNIPIKPGTGGTSLWLAAVCTGGTTPTFTAAGIKLRLGIVQG